MSQENKDKADAAEARTQQTRGFMQQVRVAARRKYTPEEKVRIVLEGFRREVAVNELCRREGIKPGAYYAWTKDFVEAGKERLTRDTVRDAFAVNAVKRNDSGDGLRLLQEHLGHQSFNTTAKYRKVTSEEHRDWYDKLWKEDTP